MKQWIVKILSDQSALFSRHILVLPQLTQNLAGGDKKKKIRYTKAGTTFTQWKTKQRWAKARGGLYTGMNVTTGIMFYHDMDFVTPRILLDIHKLKFCSYIVLFNLVLSTTFITTNEAELNI